MGVPVPVPVPPAALSAAEPPWAVPDDVVGWIGARAQLGGGFRGSAFTPLLFYTRVPNVAPEMVGSAYTMYPTFREAVH